MVKHIAPVIVLALTLQTSAIGQTIKPESRLSRVTQKALAYFEQVEEQRFSDFLRKIRANKLPRERKVKVLSMLPKGDIVSPSADGQAKLRALEPILKFHGRDSVIEFKVLRVRGANVGALTGAAVIITESALEILTAAELQAAVAHELGHEYYWKEFGLALQRQSYARMEELELCCDGIAVITLYQLNLDPQSLISAITRLNQYNKQFGPLRTDGYVSFEERVAFIQSMIKLLRRSAQEAH